MKYQVLKYLLLGYLTICALFYALHSKVLFQSAPLPSDYVWNFPDQMPYKEVNLVMDSGFTVNMVQFLPKAGPVKGIVLFFHGNKQNINHYKAYGNYITQFGYECWIPDYPGYGKSTGPLTAENMHALAMEVYKMAQRRIAADSIIIYGKSLGTGVASNLASKRDCRHLILETPYTSLSELMAEYAFFLPTSILTKENLSNSDRLPLVQMPVTIFHGTKDELIPLQQAFQLKKLLKPKDHFIVVPNATHNGVPATEIYKQTLNKLLY